ncbi:ATP-dependent zinc metalloprotease FtsH [Myxococcus sp. RHSTA-1-4]|uniref:ATP-dependent zinc metalloprotease FtsH n=1 Tax=Myxococcus sp. RHSTA-1-4 TaxID=2874601 RepID=UPI001CC14E60|nr:ATP-dependent zinc metalloprotease FtsH [Myxococcus sp. RHSTA-1-4]MBZ4419408.1 ATP-dependent zinc metalloprotease FtsH [Myxococcus sp. RHSTA-1-4]
MAVKEPKTSKWRPWLPVVLLFLGVFAMQEFTRFREPPPFTWTAFREAVSQGRVESVVITGGRIHGRLKAEAGKEAQGFTTVKVDDPELLKDLQAHGVQVSAELPENPWLITALWLLPLGVFLWLSLLRQRSGGGAGRAGGLFAVGRSNARMYAEKDIRVRFADVAGVDEAKEELREVIAFLKTPQKYRRLGGKIPKGILLVGPPGTGKTLLAKAVAGEAGVPFFSISGSEFVEMFVGVGAARVRDLFEQAQAQAPCIIFIDELDALGKARNTGPVSHEEREQTLNQLLVELDGFDPHTGVILMAATNRPEILDPALLRAGRFDRHVVVDRPDREGRLAVLKVHAAKVPLEDPKDLELIAAATVGMVGADLANIINEAALLGARRGKEKVGRAELEEAVERAVAGLEKRNRVLSPLERERVAFHELGHALMALALSRGGDAVRKVSIIPRGVAALGYTLQVPTEDRFLMTRSELEDRIAVLLGGRLAEELIFRESSTGAHDDLKKATDIARGMVMTYGMGQALGLVTVDPGRRPLFLETGMAGGRGEYSEALAERIDGEVRGIVDAQAERVRGLLGEREAVLRHAAQRLLEREVLSGEELAALLRGESVPAAPEGKPQERDAA